MAVGTATLTHPRKKLPWMAALVLLPGCCTGGSGGNPWNGTHYVSTRFKGTVKHCTMLLPCCTHACRACTQAPPGLSVTLCAARDVAVLLQPGVEAGGWDRVHTLEVRPPPSVNVVGALCCCSTAPGLRMCPSAITEDQSMKEMHSSSLVRR
jgi:hypothetical protein